MPEACVAAPASSRELQTASGSPSRGRLFRQRLRRLPGEQLNGIAVAVSESKRSTVSVSEGIHQNIDNQKPQFIQSFPSTIQLPFAGNEARGSRYAAIESPEKYGLRWKEIEAHPQAGDNPLFRELANSAPRTGSSNSSTTSRPSTAISERRNPRPAAITSSSTKWSISWNAITTIAFAPTWRGSCPLSAFTETNSTKPRRPTRTGATACSRRAGFHEADGPFLVRFATMARVISSMSSWLRVSARAASSISTKSAPHSVSVAGLRSRARTMQRFRLMSRSRARRSPDWRRSSGRWTVVGIAQRARTIVAAIGRQRGFGRAAERTLDRLRVPRRSIPGHAPLASAVYPAVCLEPIGTGTADLRRRRAEAGHRNRSSPPPAASPRPRAVPRPNESGPAAAERPGAPGERGRGPRWAPRGREGSESWAGEPRGGVRGNPKARRGKGGAAPYDGPRRCCGCGTWRSWCWRRPGSTR